MSTPAFIVMGEKVWEVVLEEPPDYDTLQLYAKGQPLYRNRADAERVLREIMTLRLEDLTAERERLLTWFKEHSG